ncbi:hypothetical protein SNOG_06327 [Parastagonospora nodorum SN15]|uniref:Uncharacterized protein n=1 Tax=Phaeosphaeria nodorum (strain SN15 / ATCC MYA-4574 / FGSC 10173) TaxID=321614 RepID=Q0UPI7_PHANO|nr:hypothetical protein SNOG_06327 [Parastagonospora nodorum SN15]EAT86158.1 hypothetical protein SNOG_06327 [Parastagonospora nodorum SN15]
MNPALWSSRMIPALGYQSANAGGPGFNSQ